MAESSGGETVLPPLRSHDDSEGAGIEIMNYLIEFIPTNSGENFNQHLVELLEKYEGTSVFEKNTERYYSVENNIENLKKNGFRNIYPVHACEIPLDKEGSSLLTLLIDHHQSIVHVFDLNGQYYLHVCENVHLAIKAHLPTFEIRLIPLKKNNSDNTGPCVVEQTELTRSLVSVVWGIDMFYRDRYLWYKWAQGIVNYRNFDQVKWKHMLDAFQTYNEMLSHTDVEKEHDLVLTMIEDSVKSLTPFDDIVNRVEGRYGGNLSLRERSFIEDKYVKICMAEFIQEAQVYLTENVEKISRNLTGFLDSFESESEIPLCFSELKYFPLLPTIQLHFTYRHFVETLKKQCLATLESKIEILNAEIEFVNETKRTLTSLFITRLSSEKSEENLKWKDLIASFNESDQISKERNFLQYLKSSNCAELQHLRTKALALDSVDRFVLVPRELARIFSPVKLETKQDNHGKVMIFKGGYIRLKDIQDKLDKTAVYEIQIIATELLCIDIDLTQPGTNFVLVSPCVFVAGERTLDVSGADGEKLKECKARSGNGSGDDGEPGKAGDSGRAGGNVFFYVESVINAENLKIKSHGGDGQDGQDGGNGAAGEDGKDGYEISQEEFDLKYPKCTTFLKFLKSQTIDSLLMYMPIVGVIIKNRYSDGEYYEMTTSKGCKVVFSAYFDSWYTAAIALFGYPKLQAYCIHWGAEGTRGGQGGMGGSGGNGGCGGMAGNVICESLDIKIENKNGRNGERGKDGTGGKWGYNGRRGLDTARTEPSQYRAVRSYGPARLELQYVSSKESTIDTAYCPHQSSLRNSATYAKIRVVNSTKGSRVPAERGVRAEKKKATSGNPIQHRSVPICVNTIVNKYRHIVETKKGSVFKVRDTTCLRIDMKKGGNSKKHTRIYSSQKLLILSTEKPDVTETANIMEAIESVSVFCEKTSLCRTSEIIDKINWITQMSNEKSERSLRLAIMAAKTVEVALTENSVDFPEELPHLYDSLTSIRTDQWYFHRLRKMITVRCELREELNNHLDKLQVVIMKKYKFAMLGVLATEISSLEICQQERSEESFRDQVTSMIKMRLIHSNYASVATMWSLSKMRQVSSFLEKRKTEIGNEVNHICNTINSFGRLASEQNEVTSNGGDFEESNATNIKHDHTDKSPMRSSHHVEDNQLLQSLRSTKELDTQHESPETQSQLVSQSMNKRLTTTGYVSENINKAIPQMHSGRQETENTTLENISGNEQTGYAESTVKSIEIPKRLTISASKKSDTEISNALQDLSDDEYNDILSSEKGAVIFQNNEKQQLRNLELIEQFRNALVKTEKYQHYIQVVESLKMLQYVDVESVELLLEVLTTKILVGGFHISPDLLLWFISRILGQTDSQSMKMFVWIISSRPMRYWLTEYTVLQLIYQGQLATENEGKTRGHLDELHDLQWVPGLWKHLFNEDIVFSDDILTSLLSALTELRELAYDDNLMKRLADTNLPQWADLLSDYSSYKRLLQLPITWTPDKVIEADAYVDELRKIHGNDIVDDMLQSITSSQNASPETFLHLLRNFYYEVWPLRPATLRNIKNEAVEKWETHLNEMYSSDKERSLTDLIEIIKDDSNNSHNFKLHHESSSDTIWSDVECVLGASALNESKVNETFGDEFVKNWKSEFDHKIKTMDISQTDKHKTLVRQWANDFRKRVKLLNKSEKEEYLWNNITEVFAHVEIGLSLITGFKMRHAQRLAAFLLVRNNHRGLLEQVSTGEGKTIIIVAFCIMKNLIGHSVDVVTSSPVLAKRDVSQNAGAYELFGVSVSHNCSENTEKRAESYKKNIVYGGIGFFQRDVLLQQFYNKQIFGKRQFDTIVVDEVDSMLLDKAENVLYLSHDIADLDALEPIFVYIWSFVHGKGMVGTDHDIAIVRAAMMNAMYGAIRKEDLEKQLDHLPADIKNYSDLIWQELLDMKILDSKGRHMRSSELRNNQIELDLKLKLKLDTNFDIDGAVLCFLKDTLRQGIQVTVPNYLEQFVDLHLSNWVESAFSARFMQERRHYIIDIDRSDVERGESANVIIMDVDTGVEQSNMQWTDGLHQFLQLKHGCRISLASLKAVFMSNLTFFKLYEGSVFGLTGTLGSKQERDVLQSLYEIDYVNLPTFRPKRFTHQEGLLFDCEEDWIEKTVETAISVAKHRPVLLICESIKELEKFRRKFLTETKLTNIELHVYKSSYEILDIVTDGKVIEKGCVILATNLAGRGTDIKISDCVDDKGGLHVIFTYMTRNMRITEQGFGRAARKGQKGSGQLCIMNTLRDSEKNNIVVDIMLMTKKRNGEEKRRLSLMKKHYDSFIKKEESYFKKFQKIYKNIQELLEDSDASEKEVALQACLDRWAFWLDSLGEILTKKTQNTDHHWNVFKTSMEEDFAKPLQVSRITGSPSSRVKLGKVYINSGKYSEAMTIFQKVIVDEPNFSDAAHYYKAHCLVRSTHLVTDDDRQLFTLHLLKAEQGFKKKIEVFSGLNSLVSSIKTLYGRDEEHFVMNDSYEQQKGDLINIFSTFVGSIRSILGHAVDINMLENVTEDIVLAGKIIERSEIFKAPTLTDFSARGIELKEEMSNFKQEQMKKLFQRYELYSRELKAKMNSLQRSNITAEDFQTVLPSRGEFWNELKAAELLYDEKEYVVVNKDKIMSASIDKNSLESVLIKISTDDFSNLFQPVKTPMINNSCDNQQNVIPICLFPEHIEEITKGNYVAIPSEKAGYIDEHFRQILKSCKAIYNNKIAHLKVEEAKSRRLTKYDGISESNLLEIPGVNATVAREIFSHLSNSGIMAEGMPRTNEIDLPKHKKFETEVKNLFNKYYLYRKLLLKTVANQELPFEELHVNPHELIWQDLIEFNIVTPRQVRGELEKEAAEKVINDEQNSLKKSFELVTTYPDQVILQDGIKQLGESTEGAWNSVCYFFGLKEVSSIALAIDEWRTGIYKYDSIDSSLKDINELLDNRLKRDASAELTLLESIGLDQIFTLQEEKWSWKAICKIVAIVILGMVQIALGVIIEVFSVGFGTFVAAGFIEEGVSDIMFAIECAFSGYCTFTEYLKHKTVSVIFTVLTGGVGAFFARGAQFSRFGYKIGAEFMIDKAGKDLIKEAGKRRLAKECTKVAGKKMAKGVAIGAVSGGIDVAVECLLRDKLKEMCNDVLNTVKSTENDSIIHDQIHCLCQKLGQEKAREIVKKLGQDCMRNENSQLVSYTIKVLDAASSGMEGALKKLEKSQNSSTKALAKVASCLSELAKYAPYLSAVAELKATRSRYNEDFRKRLQVELDKVDAPTDKITVNEEIASDIFAQIKNELVKHVEEILTNELLKPFLKHHAKKLVNITGKAIRSNYRKIQTHWQRREFSDLKKILATQTHIDPKKNVHDTPQEVIKESILSDYHSSLITLQRKVRSPELYADILREGVPMGIHEAQAISNLIGRPIKIIVCGSDGRRILPEEFEPSSAGPSNKPPLVVYFQAHDDRGVGHFSGSPDFQDDGSIKSKIAGENNCLLEAVSGLVGRKIDREAVVQIVQNDPKIQNRIQRDIHRHFVEIGGIGGVVRSEAEEKKKREIAEDRPAKLPARVKRDKPRPAGLRNTGNHELFGCAHYDEWRSRTIADGGQPKYTWVHLFVYLRVDTRYCVFDYNGSMQGHPHSVFDKKENKSRCTGSPQLLHHDVKAEIDKCTTPQEAACAALECHLDAIGSEIEFVEQLKKNPNYFKNTITATGHDLSNLFQRREFFRGLERERYKLECVLAWFEGRKCPKPGKDLKRADIRSSVENAQTIQQIGRILMSPASMD